MSTFLRCQTCPPIRGKRLSMPIDGGTTTGAETLRSAFGERWWHTSIVTLPQSTYPHLAEGSIFLTTVWSFTRICTQQWKLCSISTATVWQFDDSGIGSSSTVQEFDFVVYSTIPTSPELMSVFYTVTGFLGTTVPYG
jgi:hypothetical protein